MNSRGAAPDVIATSAPDLYAPRARIYPRRTTGRYQQLRLYVRAAMLGGLFVLPWLAWNGEPLVWLDLPARRFHILGATYFADDVFLATGVLVVAAFALFTFTNLAGRVLCGYACPHSMYFSLFIAIEDRIEGSSSARRRRDRAGWTTADRARRGATYLAWLLAGFAFAFSVMAFFVPARTLVVEVFTFTTDGWTAFWLAFLTIGCFVFAGFLREQACFYMCPYARFQSAMIDRDTLVVSYDAARGEPRGARKRATDAGDCVDCRLCVEVCPVGIDIRNGLQYQCIQCGLCVDACAPVMRKLGRAPDLVRYTTQNWLERKLAPLRWKRPRLVGYAIATAAFAVLFTVAVAVRSPIDLEVIRERHALFNTVLLSTPAGAVNGIENSYRLKVANKSAERQRFTLSAQAPFAVEWRGERTVDVDSGEIVEVPIRLQAVATDVPAGATTIEFVARTANERSAREQRFFGPSRP